MLKRLIEVALPLKEISEQSAREKSIRHGHISTLHIWWARRPLAACRAVVFASLIPDPDDPECPESFRKLVMEVLKRNEFQPKDVDGASVEDTPRNRCMEFIKYLVRWENSNKPEFIEPARKLIASAHKFLHHDADSDAPKVLDPFAGGGAIPLEALRLGCDAHAVDLNPVAHLIELCTLVYPQKYGQPDSRPLPDYIERLIAHNRTKKKKKDGAELFKEDGDSAAIGDGEILPGVEITAAEYRKNPLAADVKYWAYWVLEAAWRKVGHLYPNGPDGARRIAYLWAHTLPCPNPNCRATVPLLKRLWLANTARRKFALRMKPHLDCTVFEVVEGVPTDFDPDEATIKLGAMRCPNCGQGVYDKNEIKNAAKKGIGLQPLCVVSLLEGRAGRKYELPSSSDVDAFERATACWNALREEKADGITRIPDEKIGRDFSWVLKPPMFGLYRWGDLHNPRQAVVLSAFCEMVKKVSDSLPDDYGVAVAALLTMILGRMADKCAKQCRWNSAGEKLENVFGRQAIPMSWDYGEVNPFSGDMGDWTAHIDWVHRCITMNSQIQNQATVLRGSATQLPIADALLDVVVTDPPYYDAVPYADLSDFFYVWHKRALRKVFPALYATPLTPKQHELVQQSDKVTAVEYRKKTKGFFEDGMSQAFREMHRCLSDSGVACVMFAHKTTSAWDSLISGVLNAGLVVKSSWPFHTEMKARLRGQGAAALASSVTLVCRKRVKTAGIGLWDDVRQELRAVAQERLGFFWNQGIRGADFFISAIGPALSVFGEYEQVTKLSGEAVTVGKFLDEVRSLVSNFALAKILKTTHTGIIDPESRFYVVWKWSYADAKVPADESFKLSQALGLNTESLWDKTGVLEKTGENVQSTPVSKRMKIKDLGEPSSDGTPASLIDVLHRLCALREKGDTEAMANFLGKSGHANNHSLWLVAQAVSEILPDGEKEKQLMQGLLNQKDGLEEATRQKQLF